jgi:DNA helicase-2/ATP-dependent DNA helicase PcrA
VVFPSQRALDEGGNKSLEEERRLAYVGITRARRRAHILFAANRQIYGRWQPALPSRFIDELPQEHVEVVSRPSLYGASPPERGAAAVDKAAAASERYNTPGWNRARHRASQARTHSHSAPIEGEARVIATSDPSKEMFRVGDKVSHSKFGQGLIVEKEGAKLTVDFPGVGKKRVIDAFVKRV